MRIGPAGHDPRRKQYAGEDKRGDGNKADNDEPSHGRRLIWPKHTGGHH
jgi:hypothetical protein